MMMYADDTVIFYSDKNIARIHENLQSDFNSFVTWLEHNELIINTKIGKTETMLFGTGKRISMTEDTSLSIKHKENIINQTNSYIYLGLSLSNTLCMSQHITSSIKVASSRLNLLKKMREFMNTETAIIIYQSMILPFLTNCNFATYGATPNYLKERTVSLENRATRIIGKKVNCTDKIKIKRMCCFVHQCVYGNVCEPFQKYFELKKKQTARNLSTVNIPRLKLESARYSFYVQGAMAFNKLPKNFQTEKDETKFGSFFKKY